MNRNVRERIRENRTKRNKQKEEKINIARGKGKTTIYEDTTEYHIIDGDGNTQNNGESGGLLGTLALATLVVMLASSITQGKIPIQLPSRNTNNNTNTNTPEYETPSVAAKIDEMGEYLNNQMGNSDGTEYSNGIREDWCGNLLNSGKNELGYTDKEIPNCRSCKEGAEGFEDQKRWYDRGSCTPKRGYYVFFRWNPSSTSYDHVGWVEKVYQEDGVTKIDVISGNTPDVSRATYDINDSRIIGYGAPDYGRVLSYTTEINTKKTKGKLALDFIHDKYKYRISQDERDI